MDGMGYREAYQAYYHRYHISPYFVLDSEVELADDIGAEDARVEGVSGDIGKVEETCHGQVASLECT